MGFNYKIRPAPDFVHVTCNIRPETVGDARELAFFLKLGLEVTEANDGCDLGYDPVDIKDLIKKLEQITIG